MSQLQSITPAGGALNISFDQAQWARMQFLLRDLPAALPGAIVYAINKTGKQGRTRIARIIREHLHSKAKSFKQEGVKFDQATVKAPVGRIFIPGGYRLSVRAMGARQNKKGISYRVFEGEPLRQIPGGFLVKKLNKQFFVRKGKGRLPIIKQRIPETMAQLIEHSGALDNIKLDLTEQLHKNLDKRIADLIRIHRSVQAGEQKLTRGRAAILGYQLQKFLKEAG